MDILNDGLDAGVAVRVGRVWCGRAVVGVRVVVRGAGVYICGGEACEGVYGGDGLLECGGGGGAGPYLGWITHSLQISVPSPNE